MTIAHPQVVEYYGHGIISPVTQGVDFTLNYTLDLVNSNPSVTAFMIDNAFWGQVSEPKPRAPLPSGFGPAAAASFRIYIQQRFGSMSNILFGTNASSVVPPVAKNRSATSPSALFGAWKVWRSRTYAQAVERYRATLHARNISLLANTVFWPLKWQSGCADELQHLDAVISESHFDAGWEMSLKQGLVLTHHPRPYSHPHPPPHHHPRPLFLLNPCLFKLSRYMGALAHNLILALTFTLTFTLALTFTLTFTLAFTLTLTLAPTRQGSPTRSAWVGRR